MTLQTEQKYVIYISVCYVTCHQCCGACNCPRWPASLQNKILQKTAAVAFELMLWVVYVTTAIFYDVKIAIEIDSTYLNHNWSNFKISTLSIATVEMQATTDDVQSTNAKPETRQQKIQVRRRETFASQPPDKYSKRRLSGHYLSSAQN